MLGCWAFYAQKILKTQCWKFVETNWLCLFRWFNHWFIWFSPGPKLNWTKVWLTIWGPVFKNGTIIINFDWLRLIYHFYFLFYFCLHANHGPRGNNKRTLNVASMAGPFKMAESIILRACDGDYKDRVFLGHYFVVQSPPFCRHMKLMVPFKDKWKRHFTDTDKQT